MFSLLNGWESTLQLKRKLMVGLALALTACYVPSGWSQASNSIAVYKDPNCGCCAAWVAHLRQASFKVTVNDRADMHAVKSHLHVPQHLSSCHTAQLENYVIEGHVPAAVILRLLHEHSSVQGVAVPGMPVGSPGMEGDKPQPYQVLTYDTAGKTAVYATMNN
jgi:hypothetical protein